MPFQTLPPAGMTYCPPTKIGGALPDRQIQPFDKRCVSVEESSDRSSLCSNRRSARITALRSTFTMRLFRRVLMTWP